MKTFVYAAAMALLALNATAKGYQTDSFFGGSFTALDYSGDALDQGATLGAAHARVGATWSKSVSFELRLGTGLGEQSIGYESETYDVKLNRYYGAYFRFGCPVFHNFYPYLLLGQSKGELQFSGTSGRINVDDTGTSLGLGLDWRFHKSLSLNIEYTQFLEEDGTKLVGPSLGLVHHFY